MSKELPKAASNAAFLYSYLLDHTKTNGVIVETSKDAIFAHEAIKLLGFEGFVLPDIRANFGDDLRSFSQEILELNESLSQFYRSTNKKKFLISPVATITKYLPKKELFATHTISFADQVDQHALKEKLISWGYQLVDVTEQKGEVSFRGEVIDIFGVGMNEAVRILLDADQVESIREYDLATQKSSKIELEKIEILPALFALESDKKELLEELVSSSDFDSFFKDIASLGFWHLHDLGLATNLLTELNFCRFECEFDEFLVDKSSYENIPVVKELPSTKAINISNPQTLIEFHKDKKITIALASDAQMRAFGLNLAGDYELFYTDSALSLISGNRLIISLNKLNIRKKRRKNPKILLDELSVGDLVVHENYGVGRFSGLEQVAMLGGAKDFVVINYAGEDKLLIPVENIYLIDRFVGDSLPMLDRLGKGSFLKLKESAKKDLYEIAGEIVKRAAERQTTESSIIEIDRGALEEFQNRAGFDYTADQQRAVETILTELASGQMMDRLLSADVGFGKTEVAMNAIFATVRSGFQAALIVPTTLLSNQHYQTLRERFREYEFKIAKLDRFTSANEKKSVIAGLKDGTISVVVGTHALFAAEFASLALMVVDEEHKFGVKQKEQLKDKSKDLHLLSMSATPIPRSLNMALSQIKGFSEILTPPEEREAVRTMVKESDDAVIKEAITRELRRGGQIFYVFNRIAGIEAKKDDLEALMPNLKILVLHSKVASEITEKELVRFSEGKYDLLLSTTIIESGIHMPSVNTIIVDGADRFGIADLHQLRGRVGRSFRQGYCYFLVEAKEALTDDAKKRLIALENNSHLGSGTALAFHDLEIRGGGNILGADQSGHIKQIGYSLYLKMLEDALNDLQGNKKPRIETPVDLRLAVKAYIDEETVEEERLRLELYRRFAQTTTLAEVYELENEMIDRFGTIGAFTRNFIDLMAIKIMAVEKGFAVVQSYETNISFTKTSGEKTTITSPSKDDDDVIKTTSEWLKLYI